MSERSGLGVHADGKWYPRACDECGALCYPQRVGSEYLCDDCVSYRQAQADVPHPIFDGGDIDNHGNWAGTSMSCLVCRETSHLRLTSGPAYCSNDLICGGCGTMFASYFF